MQATKTAKYQLYGILPEYKKFLVNSQTGEFTLEQGEAHSSSFEDCSYYAVLDSDNFIVATYDDFEDALDALKEWNEDN